MMLLNADFLYKRKKMFFPIYREDNFFCNIFLVSGIYHNDVYNFFLYFFLLISFLIYNLFFNDVLSAGNTKIV
jgi:hypothetical protein